MSRLDCGLETLIGAASAIAWRPGGGRSLRVGCRGGVATFIAHAARGASQNDVSRRDTTGETVRTLARDLRDGAWSTGRQFNKMTAFALAAVSPDGTSAVTLDESGVVQLFPATAKALIAQACQRQPAPLRGALRALLPPESQAVDACGRREEKSDEDDGR